MHLVEDLEGSAHLVGLDVGVDHGVVGDGVGLEVGLDDLLLDLEDLIEVQLDLCVILYVLDLQGHALQYGVEGDDVGSDLRQLVVHLVEELERLVVVALLEAGVEERVVGGEVRDDAFELHLVQDVERVELGFVREVVPDVKVVLV